MGVGKIINSNVSRNDVQVSVQRKGGKGKKAAIILLVVMVLSFLGYIVAYYVSARSIEIAIQSFSFRTTDVISAIFSRKVDLDIYLRVTGRGPLTVNVKAFSARIYIEDIYAGVIRSFEGFSIPAGGSRTVHLILTLDLSSVSLGDIQRIVSVLSAGEVKISLEGWVDVIVLFTTITVPFSHTRYMLVGSGQPEVDSALWDVTEASAGEAVGFTVVVRNKYRGASISGKLTVVVMEDIAWGFDKEAARYDFQIQLGAGEIRQVSGTFTTYAHSNTRGFYLKIYWNGNLIYEMSSAYPPRLAVRGAGSIEVVDAYWIVNGIRTYTCTLGDEVEAHVIIRAVGGSVSGTITLKVRKDISLAPDVDFAARDFVFSLNEGEFQELVLKFTPNEVSSSKLRGYFIELEGLASWTMPNTYPPRLTVKSRATEGQLSLLDVYWVVNGERVTVCKVNDRVTAHIVVKAEGGYVKGMLTVKVRKDIPLAPDVDYKVVNISVDLTSGQTMDITIVFYPDAPSSITLRGYFIELEGLISWTMPNIYPPRLKVTS